MNLQDLETLKNLIEAGDKSSLELHILKNVLTKGDMTAAAKVNGSIESEKDSLFNTYLDTWKSNNLQVIVDEKVKELNPSKSPAELEVEKLRAEIESERAARTREALKLKALGTLSAESLNVEDGLLERLIGNDEETTQNNLELFKGFVQNVKQSTLDGVYKDNGTKPPIGTVGGGETVAPLRDLANAANLRNK